jgi:hypothetical protein
MNSIKTFSTKEKIAAASTREQQLLLDENGRVLESDDSIFSTKNFGEKSVVERFSFFESVWPALLFSENKSVVTEFKAVQNVERELPGIYDFKFFVKFLEKKSVVIWTISEQTDRYSMLQKRQQTQADRTLRLQKRTLAQ